MDDELDFQNYLYLSPKSLKIKILRKQDLKDLYFNETYIETNSNKLNFELVDFFLEKNIFQIEKKTNKFIENVNLL